MNLINSGSEQIAKQMSIPTEYVDAANHKFARKIIQNQINVDKIANNAQQELLQETFDDSTPASTDEVSTDWLNIFENEASTKNSEEIQLLFGKILAGEIKKPATFSIRTVKILAQVNSQVAKLFQKFCSICSTIYIDNKIVHCTLFSLGKHPGSNGLSEFGINAKNLNLLIEYGLIESNFGMGMNTTYYINGLLNSKSPIPFHYNNNVSILKNQEGKSIADNHRLDGSFLTSSGEELLRVIDIIPNEKYTEALIDYLNKAGLHMIKTTT